MNAPEFDERFRNKLAELFQWRRDVRHFKSDAVPDGLLERLVRQASLSPSVGYSQPWRFVHVRSPHRRDAVIASFERANAEALAGYSGDDATKYAQLKLSGLREAPVHLAVFCDDETLTGRGLGRATMPETLAYSATMAIYTFWLTARAEGVGAGWVSILEPEVVTQALDVPKDWRLIAYLCVGYPKDESDAPELKRAGWETSDQRSTQVYVR
ncbi:MAG: 5,6-dimethylbenzimidazole synthase [Candidatus Eremiobacteraeota bacterium]|nr:5,6-dimethylbenzimidazole synthase [Candidatus Eremiobacteraeota bacterium]